MISVCGNASEKESERANSLSACQSIQLWLAVDDREILDPVRVLIVEDEPKLANLLRKGLTAQGLAADLAMDADEAMYMAMATAYDAITLDVMLPDVDGFTLCRDFRRHGVAAPVLMITALDTIHDRVTGLDSGADD